MVRLACYLGRADVRPVHGDAADLDAPRLRMGCGRPDATLALLFGGGNRLRLQAN